MGEHGTASRRCLQSEADPGVALPDLLRGEADDVTAVQKRSQSADCGCLANTGASLQQDPRRHVVLRFRRRQYGKHRYFFRLYAVSEPVHVLSSRLRLARGGTYQG